MPLLQVFFIAVTLYYFAAVLFLLRGLLRLPSPGAPAGLSFSVVIAARNEAEHIGRCLESIFRQTLPSHRYEVIVVNDRSTDATEAICTLFSIRHTNLRILSVSETPPGIAPKKFAVSRGVGAARNEIIVFTDADCLVSPAWLATIDRCFTSTTGLVQGIAYYFRPEGMGSLLFGLQAVDFLSHGIVAASAIGAGMPINSSASNFAFRKKTFAEIGGYGTSAARVVSGDDDLLLQRIAGSGTWRVGFMNAAEAAVSTAPTDSAAGIFEQRKRWGSKTVNYSPRRVAFLGGIFLYYCGIPASLLASIVHPLYLATFAGMVAAKIAGEYLLMMPGTAIYNQKALRRYILPASLLQLPTVLAAVVLGVFGKFSWKGERFKREVGKGK
jgi:cellulose synthase/poly-beta-1,6-N-acetylglucosamine synthase-like glycosyltransferase